MLLNSCRNKSPVANISVLDLKCEMLKNPVGIDSATPRLSWMLSSDQRSTKQTSYQVLVASSEALLDKDPADLWDTEENAGDFSTGVVYQGNALKSQMQGMTYLHLKNTCLGIEHRKSFKQ